MWVIKKIEAHKLNASLLLLSSLSSSASQSSRRDLSIFSLVAYHLCLSKAAKIRFTILFVVFAMNVSAIGWIIIQSARWQKFTTQCSFWCLFSILCHRLRSIDDYLFPFFTIESLRQNNNNNTCNKIFSSISIIRYKDFLN